MTCRYGWFVAAIATVLPNFAIASSSLIDAIPATTLAAYFFHPDAPSIETQAQPTDTVHLLSRLADQASAWGMFANMDLSIRGWIDVFSSLEPLTAFPHALVLLDIDAAPRTDGGHELSRCQAVLLIHTGTDTSIVERRIQLLLAKYTNNEDAQLTQSTTLDRPVQVLRDRRLPNWAVIRWGRLGELYVITIGDQAFENIAESLEKPVGRLAQDRWFAESFDQLRVSAAKVTLYLNLRRIAVIGDSALKDKISHVRRVLNLDGSSQFLAALHKEGRTILLQASMERDNQTVRRLLARPLSAAEESAVPKEAAWVMPLDVTPTELYKSGWDAYLAAKSPHARQSCLDSWREMESASQVVIERDILEALRAPIVIHNYPPHSLGIPLAVTIQIPIGGDAAAFRANVDRLCEYGRQQLQGVSVLSLNREADGIWFIRFGLDGPGVVVTDRDVVISFSPVAIRRVFAARSSAVPGK